MHVWPVQVSHDHFRKKEKERKKINFPQVRSCTNCCQHFHVCCKEEEEELELFVFSCDVAGQTMSLLHRRVHEMQRLQIPRNSFD